MCVSLLYLAGYTISETEWRTECHIMLDRSNTSHGEHIPEQDLGNRGPYHATDWPAEVDSQLTYCKYKSMQIDTEIV